MTRKNTKENASSQDGRWRPVDKGLLFAWIDIIMEIPKNILLIEKIKGDSDKGVAERPKSKSKE